MNQKYQYHTYVRSLAMEISEVNNRKLKESELTTSQGMLLGCINRLLTEGQKISRKKLQDNMRMSGPSITSLLNALERKGFIIRQPGEQDGRTFRLEVTAKGKHLLAEMDDVFVQTEEQMMQGFSERERMLFLELLERSYSNLRKRQK